MRTGSRGGLIKATGASGALDTRRAMMIVSTLAAFVAVLVGLLLP